MRKLILGIVVGLGLSAGAQAALVDFNAAGTADLPISLDGLDFAYTGGHAVLTGGPSSLANPNGDGTNALIAGFEAVVTITRTGGGSFTLTGLNIAVSWYVPGPSANILINGAMIELSTSSSYKFLDLTATSFTITTPTVGYWVADNIDWAPVSSGPDTTVAEPASLALYGLGLLGFAATRRRPR